MRQHGLTLIELLAAIALSSIVLAAASGVFLRANTSLHARLNESKGLQEAYIFKAALVSRLRGIEVEDCSHGDLSYLEGPESVELGASLKQEMPGLEQIKFTCFERDALEPRLVEWRNRPRPQLVEYSVTLKTSGGEWRWQGSVLR